jgi:hypothetical protein
MNFTDETSSISVAVPAVPEDCSASQPARSSRLISKVLSPAIRLWFRAQVEAITGLKFQIQGSDREILRGCVPKVEVQAQQIVYQGLHLSQADLTASHIQINLGQVLQGKPLQLLEVVPVVGTVRLAQADLDASVHAPLLKQGLADFLAIIFNHLNQDPTKTLATELALCQPIQLQDPQIQLASECFTLTANLLTASQQHVQIKLAAQVQIKDGSCLQFTELEMHYTLTNQPPSLVSTNQPLVIDLGSEVQLYQLEITAAGVLCQGRINVTS